MKKIIKITESDLRNIVGNVVKNIIKEDFGYSSEELESAKMQAKFKQKAENALTSAGYEIWENDSDNDLVITVAAKSPNDKDIIRRILTRTLGIVDYDDLRIKNDSNLFGNDNRLIITLPYYSRCK